MAELTDMQAKKTEVIATRRVKAAAPKVKPMKKSVEAYRTISEVAADLDVATHVLRFWESKFNAIKPLKKSGGRRYYRPEDVALLKHIQALLYKEGYTIKGVQTYLAKTRKQELNKAVERHLTPAMVVEEVTAIRQILVDALADDDNRLSNEPKNNIDRLPDVLSQGNLAAR